MKEINRRETGEVRVVVEVDGKPIGFLQIDVDRLWPLIEHRSRENASAIEWMDSAKFNSVVRAAVAKRLVSRLAQHLYPTVGDEIVKAELDIEAFRLRAEAAAQTFGPTKADIEKLVGDSGKTTADFYTFFWEYLLEDREIADLKKEWKAARNRPQ